MRKRSWICLAILLTVPISSPLAQQRAVTENGRKVLLYDDGTWAFADQLSLPKQAIRLPSPPLTARYGSKRQARRARFKLISSKRNKITNDQEWLSRHELVLPTCAPPRRGQRGTCPSRMPTAYRKGPIRSAIKGARSWFMLYGEGRYRLARYLAIADQKLSRVEKILDFYHYLYPAGLPRNEFNTQEVNWLSREGNILYLSNGHRTYAKSSRGKNAYLQAIDLENDRLIWRSKPLVCNAVNFVISGDTIICGYGFTAEPDFLYALDKRTGHVISRKKLKSGPSYIFLKQGRIYVRTYDHDYIFELVNN